MPSKKKLPPPEAAPSAAPDLLLSDDDWFFILALCRTAIASGDEILRHSVERLRDHWQATGRAAEVERLDSMLRGNRRNRAMAPVRLTRSFATPGKEALTRAARVPVDKESAAPLADIIWQDDLPPDPPVLPDDLAIAFDAFVAEWGAADKLSAIGVAPTRSLLVYGAPGTGKTQAALSLAAHLGLPAVVARLDGLMSSFLGTTSRNIGHLFDFAERYDCVLVLDEFDAIAKLRDDPQEMGEIKRVVNTLLQRLDGRRETGITIGLTNHEQLLDPAVWRRFDVQLHMPAPSLEARHVILRRYLAPVQLPEADEGFLAWLCADMTGSEIESFVRTCKRMMVLAEKAYSNIFELARLGGSLHRERIREDRRQLLLLPEQVAARQLASDATIDAGMLSAIFGRSKSTISRWLAH